MKGAEPKKEITGRKNYTCGSTNSAGEEVLFSHLQSLRKRSETGPVWRHLIATNTLNEHSKKQDLIQKVRR